MIWAQCLVRNLRYRLAWYHWVFFDPAYRLGDPSLGHGDTRIQNRQLLLDRKMAREPQPENYGLSDNEIISLRWIGCFAALVSAVGLLLCGIALWTVTPRFTIVLLILSLLALIGALWQYNEARFEDRKRGG